MRPPAQRSREALRNRSAIAAGLSRQKWHSVGPVLRLSLVRLRRPRWKASSSSGLRGGLERDVLVGTGRNFVGWRRFDLVGGFARPLVSAAQEDDPIREDLRPP